MPLCPDSAFSHHGVTSSIRPSCMGQSWGQTVPPGGAGNTVWVPQRGSPCSTAPFPAGIGAQGRLLPVLHNYLCRGRKRPRAPGALASIFLIAQGPGRAWARGTGATSATTTSLGLPPVWGCPGGRCLELSWLQPRS